MVPPARECLWPAASARLCFGFLIRSSSATSLLARASIDLCQCCNATVNSHSPTSPSAMRSVCPGHFPKGLAVRFAQLVFRSTSILNCVINVFMSGKYSSAPGAVSCTDCESSQLFAPHAGSSFCQACPQGSFSTDNIRCSCGDGYARVASLRSHTVVQFLRSNSEWPV